MRLFDFVFIACFLIGVGWSGWIASLAVRRRWSDARRQLVRLAVVAMLYQAVVVAVGLASPPRFLAPDQLLQYDDWCLGVHGVSSVDAIGSATTAGPADRFVVVTLLVVSQARRVAQAAPAGSLVYLVDGNGTRFAVSASGQAAFEASHGPQPRLTTRLAPGGSFQTTRVFEIPRAATGLSLGHRHGSGFPFPQQFIIGDGFRSAPVLRLKL